MRKVKDHFYFKAKKENYPARSVYKLKEIDKKYRIIKKGYSILDLGAAPGSWAKYCSEIIGSNGLVIGIDKENVKMQLPDNVTFFKQDVNNLDLEKIKSTSSSFDVVLSDMAPATTGMRDVDQIRSLELVQKAFSIAKELLKPNGHFIAKIFQGPDIKNLLNEIKPNFQWVKTVKPAGTRRESFETFIVAFSRKKVNKV